MSMFSKATIAPLLWLLPFLGAFLLLPVSDGLQVAGVVTVLLGILGYFLCTERKIKFNIITFLVLGLWVLAFISAMMSEVPFVSLTYFYFFSAFPITFLIFQMVDGARVFPAMRWMIAALSVSSLVQFYFMPQMLKFNGAHWPFEDNNSLAIILAVGALMFLGNSFSSGRFAKYDWIAAVLCFAGVMTTGAVAVFLSFFLVAIVFIALVRPKTYRPVIYFLLGVIGLMAVMGKSEFSFSYLHAQQTYTADSILSLDASPENKVSGERYMIWKSAIEIIKLNPVIGTGIGTFFLYYPEFRNINDGSAGYMVHNDLIQMTSEMGFLVPLIALTIVGFVIFYTVYGLCQKMREQERLNRLIAFAAFGLLVGYSLVNFNFYILPTLMMIGFFLSFLNSKFTQHELSLQPYLLQQKMLREGSVVLAGLIILAPLWAISLSEYHTKKAMEELGREDVQAFSDHLNAAGHMAMGYNGRAILQGAKFAALVGQEDRALGLLADAEAVDPRLVAIYVERADILSRRENLDAALAEANKALHLDAGSIPARMKVADILELMGKVDEAYSILSDGLKGPMRSRDPREYYQRLATLSLERADMDVNREVLKRLSQLK